MRIVMDTTLGYLVGLAAYATLVIGAFAYCARAAELASVTQTMQGKKSPLFGVAIPTGYRQWEMVAISYEAPFDEFRGILGNPAAVKAYKDGTLPFPDGAILAKLAWKRIPSSEFDGAFIPGRATTVQIMVKNSKKYASTGGWGFGRFVDRIPADEAQHRTCFACHRANVKNHDDVFTRYVP
jgi:Cytochrome P460